MFYIEGRHLKNKPCKKCKKAHEKSLQAAAKVCCMYNGGARTGKVEYVEDFRPTSPGNSPGIGHSLHN